jgi:hypothetical protein
MLDKATVVLEISILISWMLRGYVGLLGHLQIDFGGQPLLVLFGQ